MTSSPADGQDKAGQAAPRRPPMRSAAATSLRNALSGCSPAEARELAAALDPDELSFLLGDWQVFARDDQLPPEATGSGIDWRVWLILGGRGAGKTRAGAEWVRARALGLAPLASEPASPIALVGETIGDVRRVMIEGPSGLLAIHGAGERPRFEPSKQQVVWPNGAVAQMFSAEDPEACAGHSSPRPGATRWRSGGRRSGPG